MATETATPNAQNDKRGETKTAAQAPTTPSAPATPSSSTSQALQVKFKSGSTLTRPPLPNGRPIEPSYLRISDKATLPGNRPVFVSDLTIAEGGFPGRPVFGSPLKGKITSTIMGNRPVASNDLGDSDLMGFI